MNPVAGTYNSRIFTTGKAQSRPRRSIIIRATGTADNDLKTVAPIKYIHAWNFHPKVSEESIRSFLHKKHPNIETFSIKKPEPEHSRDNCFILGVPMYLFDFICLPITGLQTRQSRSGSPSGMCRGKLTPTKHFFVTKTKKLDMIYQNFRRLKSRRTETKNILHTFPSNLLALTETRLDDSVFDSEVFRV